MESKLVFSNYLDTFLLSVIGEPYEYESGFFVGDGMSQQVSGRNPVMRLSGLVGLVCGGILLSMLFNSQPVAVGEAAPSAAVLANGEELFQLCSQCHGSAGEGNVSLLAPGIAGREAWYLEAQLVKFREGIRGLDHRDDKGMVMAPMARSLRTPEDITAVAAYSASLPSHNPSNSVSGDVKKGAQAFLTCQACHGVDGKGMAALKAPSLVGMEGWYIKSQLEKFKAGIRGTNPKDTTGMQMRAMSLTLVGDTAIQDVAAYIESME